MHFRYSDKAVAVVGNGRDLFRSPEHVYSNGKPYGKSLLIFQDKLMTGLDVLEAPGCQRREWLF